ncbi:MAG: ISAzo13-like element transposase-related protein [Gammaproteobacteria bacterium]
MAEFTAGDPMREGVLYTHLSRCEISRCLREMGTPASCHKEALQALTELLGLEIRIAHYPPYCSKHNPIEHRLFPHITRACLGVMFHSVKIAKQFMEKAKTRTGLKITVDVLQGIYETGKKGSADFIKNRRIVFDDCLPRWNYRTLPQGR